MAFSRILGYNVPDMTKGGKDGMESIYQVEGTLNRGFVGQITYTVCLEKSFRRLDVGFTFDQRRYTESDVTPALIEEIQSLCREKYGLTGTEEETRRAILNDMKTEIHTLAELNGQFIGCVHKQLLTRHMIWDGEQASEGCIPQPVIDGVLKVTILVFNVLKDQTHYALHVQAE